MLRRRAASVKAFEPHTRRQQPGHLQGCRGAPMLAIDDVHAVQSQGVPSERPALHEPARAGLHRRGRRPAHREDRAARRAGRPGRGGRRQPGDVLCRLGKARGEVEGTEPLGWKAVVFVAFIYGRACWALTGAAGVQVRLTADGIAVAELGPGSFFGEVRCHQQLRNTAAAANRSQPPPRAVRRAC